MAKQILAPRKQRTRQHIIADLSVHHVEGFILEAGHTAQRLSSDYSYDLLLRTLDQDGYAEPGLVYIQLKATDSLQAVGANYVFDVDMRVCVLSDSTGQVAQAVGSSRNTLVAGGQLGKAAKEAISLQHGLKRNPLFADKKQKIGTCLVQFPVS